jgi:hypothetical protein
MSSHKRKNERQQRRAVPFSGADAFVNKHQRVLLAIISSILLATLWQLKQYQDLPTWDGVYYIRYSLASVFPPGYPFAIAVFKLFTGDGILAARLVSMIFLCGIVVVTYLLARCYTSPRWAMVAALIVAINPLSLRLGVETMSEATYVFFELLSFYCVAKGWEQDRGAKYFSLAGLSAAYAYITRPEAIVFAGALMVLYAISKRRWNNVVFFVGAFAAVILVTASIGYAATGTFVLTKKASNFRIVDPVDWWKNEQMKRAIRSAPTTGEIIESVFRNYGTNFVLESKDLATYIGVPIVLLALYGLIKRRIILWAAMLEYFLFPVFSGLALRERFVFPYLPFLVVLSIIALSGLRSFGLRVAVTVLLFFSAFAGYGFVKSSSDPFFELKTAGQLMRPYVNDSSLVVDKKPYTAFYAGLRADQFLEIPNETLDNLYAFSIQNKVTHLVLSYRLAQIFRPQLLLLFDPQAQKALAKKFPVLLTCYQGTEYQVTVFSVQKSDTTDR